MYVHALLLPLKLFKIAPKRMFSHVQHLTLVFKDSCAWLPLVAPDCPWLPMVVPGCPVLTSVAQSCPCTKKWGQPQLI